MNILTIIDIGLFGIITGSYSLYYGLMIKISKIPVKTKYELYKYEKPTLSMSLIIPTYNEESLIEKKIDNTFKMNYPKDLFEVIIVDSSTDKTVEIIKELQKNYPITLLQEKREGLAKALNTAYAYAKNDIVIKTDCDSLLDKDVLQKMAEDFSNKTIGGVAGRQAVINDSKVEKDYRSMQSKLQIGESFIDSTVIFHPLSAYRKNLIKPIDIDSLADDTELAIKVRKQGYRAVVDPDILYYEASHSSFFKRRKQKDRRGKGLIGVLLRNTDIIFNKKYGYYGKIIFPMNFFMIVLSPYILMGILILSLVILFQYSFIITIIACIMLAIFIYLGQSDRLHNLGPIYSFVDSQISLLIGGMSLIFGKDSCGTWEVDKELRDVCLKEN